VCVVVWCVGGGWVGYVLVCWVVGDVVWGGVWVGECVWGMGGVWWAWDVVCGVGGMWCVGCVVCVVCVV